MAEQSVKTYPLSHYDAYDIALSMQDEIDRGWRVHCCVNTSGCIVVVYEKEK